MRQARATGSPERAAPRERRWGDARRCVEPRRHRAAERLGAVPEHGVARERVRAQKAPEDSDGRLEERRASRGPRDLRFKISRGDVVSRLPELVVEADQLERVQRVDQCDRHVEARAHRAARHGRDGVGAPRSRRIPAPRVRDRPADRLSPPLELGRRRRFGYIGGAQRVRWWRLHHFGGGGGGGGHDTNGHLGAARLRRDTERRAGLADDGAGVRLEPARRRRLVEHRREHGDGAGRERGAQRTAPLLGRRFFDGRVGRIVRRDIFILLEGARGFVDGWLDCFEVLRASSDARDDAGLGDAARRGAFEPARVRRLVRRSRDDARCTPRALGTRGAARLARRGLQDRALVESRRGVVYKVDVCLEATRRIKWVHGSLLRRLLVVLHSLCRCCCFCEKRRLRRSGWEEDPTRIAGGLDSHGLGLDLVES
mmetsp:Transcript_26029/g.104127  ORF Transcript_26029/g.104127 Transcript_26029/m.104127 type:complete len:428 (-) Transcript_26029:134-1417(-)